MATTTSSAASTPAPAGTTAQAATSGRPQLKSSISANPTGSGNRRSAQSPVDGSQRRGSSHMKGWQTNAAQQKYNGSAVPHSSSPTPSQASANMKSRAASTAPSGESDTHDRHMHDRTLYLLTKLMNREVVVTVKSGAQYTGTFVAAEPRSQDVGVSLRSVKLLKAGLGDNEEMAKEGEYAGGSSDKVVVFEPRDVVEIAAFKVTFDTEAPSSGTQNGATGFKTDTDISGNVAPRAERELHRWQPDESPEVGLGLEDTAPGPSQGWNQFEANERLFGVKSDFDENLYTTKLDRDHPEYQRRAAAAARIAAEIEGQMSHNSHVAEERGLTLPDDSGLDEEDKYSGVHATIPVSSNPNRYTPPARRAPTGQPTVPGAPHDPAIIASQLVRPETLQPKQLSQPAIAPTVAPVAQPASKTPDEPVAKPKERPSLPESIVPVRSLPADGPSIVKAGETPAIENLSINFKKFVTNERERVKKKKADMVIRDRESKLRELKKFSESFTLKTAVPSDLVPILTKDKAKQAEILEKTKAAAKAANAALQNTTTATTSSVPSTTPTISGLQSPQTGKVPPPNSFAAKDPARFLRETTALLQNFPKFTPPPTSSLSQSVRRVQLDKTLPVRPPMPVPEQPRPQFPPTGPAASTSTSSTGVNAPKRFNVKAKTFEFKPNPSAAAFTPTFGSQPTVATPAAPAVQHSNATARAVSPSLFFQKKPRTDKERPLIRDFFNPFERMKKTKAAATQTGPPPSVKLYGNSNDYIDKPCYTHPTWPAEEANKEKSYKTMFAVKMDFDHNTGHSPQPPHMMQTQPHHQQLPQHIPHITHPPHVPHQPHHGPIQQHLGIPPHYEQDPHLRQMSSPSSVMPSPNLHNATVAPYQSPVPHPSQIAIGYQQGAMGQYPGAPGGPQFGFYNNGFRTAGGNPMMMPGPQPVQYPPGQMVGGQFVHPQMYSPQQPQAYMNAGPPPPTSQGYSSPGRPAPMMMHQGSSQGTPGGAQMMPYGMQPGQGAPMYGAQGQQPQMGMMRGQQLPPQQQHQGGPPPQQQQQYYHGPQGHYPPGNNNRGNAYAVPPTGPQHMPPQQQQMVPPPQPSQQQQSPEAGEDGK